jgi:hypothetical protein
MLAFEETIDGRSGILAIGNKRLWAWGHVDWRGADRCEVCAGKSYHSVKSVVAREWLSIVSSVHIICSHHSSPQFGRPLPAVVSRYPGGQQKKPKGAVYFPPVESYIMDCALLRRYTPNPKNFPNKQLVTATPFNAPQTSPLPCKCPQTRCLSPPALPVLSPKI